MQLNYFFLDHHLYWFSYTDPDGYCRNITQVGDHLYIGLKQFFELFPWLQQMDFFITGESFAGKYIPSIGNAIWEGNKDEDFIINLQVWSIFFFVLFVSTHHFNLKCFTFFQNILHPKKRVWHLVMHYPIQWICLNMQILHIKLVSLTFMAKI